MTAGSGDILRITALTTIGGKDIQNVYHAQMEGTGDVDNTTLLFSIQSKLALAHTKLAPDQSTLLIAVGISVFNVTRDEVIGQTTFGAYTGGINPDGMLPIQTCGLVLFHTLQARSQGRKFLGGFVEDASDASGNPDATVLGRMIDYSADMLSPHLIGTGFMSFGNYRYDPARFSDWVSANVSLEWKTQRRRYYSRGS